MPPPHTGGCQCGAIRFRVTGPLPGSSICHCRMCQKAFGGHYAPLVSVRGTDFAFTRGEPKRFASSNVVLRGFCGDCGTPLTCEAPDGVAVAAGAFDDPDGCAPDFQHGIEAHLRFFAGLHLLPESRTEDGIEAVPFLDSLVNFQHPDHDTETWPPEGRMP